MLLSRGDFSGFYGASSTVLPTEAPKLQWRETYGENFFVPWVSFALLALFAEDTRGGVAELEKPFLIQKCLSTQQAKRCVTETASVTRML